MRFLAEVVERTVNKDNTGRVLEGSETYTFKRKIRIDFITNFGQDNVRRNYGIEVSSSHRTFTYETAALNEFIRFKNKVYRIKEVIEYPRSSALILELIR